MNVLLIDAGADIHAIVSISLEVSGMHVISVTHPSEALAMTGAGVDVILLDYEAGGGDGVDTMTLLRSRQHLAHVPVIFLSTHAEPLEVAEMLAAGAAGLICKPLDPVHLGDQIRTMLAGGDPIALAPQRKESLIDSVLLEALRELEASREGFFASLVAEFLDDARDRMRHITDAVEGSRPLEVRANAHALSDGARNVGASRLAAEAHRLEQLLQSEDARPSDVTASARRLSEVEALTRRAFEDMVER